MVTAREAGMRGTAVVGAVVVAALILAAAPASVAPVAATRAASGPRSHVSQTVVGAVIDHRYRIVGKIRLIFFWTGGSTVGGARLTSQTDDESSVLSLLIGSDPQRAPRDLNEWGYVREVIRPDGAEMFAVKTEAAAPPVMPGDDSKRDGSQRFGAVCALVNGGDVRSVSTTVAPRPSVTYRTFGRVLEALGAAPHWKSVHVAQPPGSAPGFLTALDRLLRGAAGGRPVIRHVAYVYNDKIYELDLQRQRTLREAHVGSRVFDRLVRTDIRITERPSGEVTELAATFEPDGPCAFAPVQIIVQPSWWLSIELQLDDEVDVPPDPASDESSLTRMQGICASARH